MSGSGRRDREIVRLRPVSYSTSDGQRLRLPYRRSGLASRRVLAAKVAITEIVNTDQGSQFTSPEFTGLLKDNSIQISMDGKGCWRDNVFVERLWKSVKYEEVYLHAYDSVSEAKRGLEKYFTFYNQRRPHTALDDKTPDEFYFRQPACTAKSSVDNKSQDFTYKDENTVQAIEATAIYSL